MDGQIFTKDAVAAFMVSLFTLGKKAAILDPCFGKGAFLSALIQGGWKNIHGIEIDAKLVEYCQARFPECKLRQGDFLLIDNKVDGIIVNPPYIRQEKIDKSIYAGLFPELASNANLYMYFVLKSISLLKENGELIVIFPGSWLQAKSGDPFKEALQKECHIEREIHISGELFEGNPLVDVIILKLIKNEGPNAAAPEFVRLENGQIVSVPVKNRIFLLDFPRRFQEIATIRRGLTTGFNSMFINPDADGNYTKEILSSPRQVQGFSTKNARFDRLLTVEKEEDLQDYLAFWKMKILSEQKPKTLYNKILAGKDWTKLSLFDGKGILFSYFIRSTMKFIWNQSECIIRDNFYIIKPKINEMLCFALLNNYYTWYQLECTGKKYGAGLLKLQRYDLENLKFPDFDTFTLRDIEKLKALSGKLIKTGEVSIIKEITSIISNYANIDAREIQTDYERLVAERLEE